MNFELFKEVLLKIERHRDLAHVFIEAVGMSATLFGAIWVLVKYFADRKEARNKAELDLRRIAYFELFSTIPIQRAALGKFLQPNREPIPLSAESFAALYKLQLLATEEALKCIITRNGIYHEGVLQLTALKREALDLDDLKLICEQQKQEVQSRAKKLNDAELDAALKEEDGWQARIDRISKQRVHAWEAFIARFRALLIDLNNIDRALLPLARREIQMPGNMRNVFPVMEYDEKVALNEFDNFLDRFRQDHSLILPASR